ncbi:hypothetical protein KSK37_11765 [Kaistella sp. DKR-2]|uniref:hypothetical protein n=1 Tax=Kaistella soli TaxID=2849654 RepID=UPI001C26FB13|nr:hypothetical protein [Kaistella soli]MBU8883762.1 hypothetical protein [Kaistella soli]
MQNLQDIQEKIFFESKSILETLSKINSREELLAKQDLFAEITDRIAFLRILEKNKDSFIEEVDLHNTGNQENTSQLNPKTEERFEDAPSEEDLIEEEVIFTNELNEIENDEDLNSENEVNREVSAEDHQEKNIVPASEIVSTIAEETQPNYEDIVAQKERDFLELEERRRKIVEFNKEDVIHPPKDVSEDSHTAQHAQEKKFKLAHIKGLRAVQNLFDEDPLEKMEENEAETAEEKMNSGSMLKSNIPTDFMEAEKRKPEFRLDLNDKVAFIRHLFDGDAVELKITIDKLNSFTDLEQAKSYLSDIYYSKDWKKSDEYAQRLWNLVENKFL